jgi:hypothetical protein
VLTKIGLFVGGLVVGGLAVGLWMQHSSAPKIDTPFQAVLLDSGQVYYGKVTGLGTDFPVLHDVYYIQSAQDPQTKQVSNVLIRRGKEWHGPEETVINARHLIMVEPISPDSKVAALIAEQEAKDQVAKK